MKKKNPTSKPAPRSAPFIQIGGDSADRRDLLDIVAKNLPSAIASGQREIVASLLDAVSRSFPTHASVTNSTFSARGDE